MVLLNSGVVCWGEGDKGQLGDGTRNSSQTPVKADFLGAVTITAGYKHTCSVDVLGDLYCWGENNDGQLGVGDMVERPVPTAVTSLSLVSGVSAGEQHTCAWLSGGGAWCWGEGSDGRLGDGTPNNSNVPVAVVGLTNVDHVSANTSQDGGGHSCVVTSNHEARCWGNNDDGQLGDGTLIDRWTPVPVN